MTEIHWTLKTSTFQLPQDSNHDEQDSFIKHIGCNAFKPFPYQLATQKETRMPIVGFPQKNIGIHNQTLVTRIGCSRTSKANILPMLNRFHHSHAIIGNILPPLTIFNIELKNNGNKKARLTKRKLHKLNATTSLKLTQLFTMLCSLAAAREPLKIFFQDSQNFQIPCLSISFFSSLNFFIYF